MGGWGSGPRRPGGRKWAVENCHVLDVAALRRAGVLAAGDRAGSLALGGYTPRGTVDYAVTVGETGGVLRLVYRLPKTDERFDYPVRLEPTPCRFGGRRWWLVCPLAVEGKACGRRVQKLYLAARYFGCRSCLGLTYASTQASDSRVYAAARDEDRVGYPEREVRALSATALIFALKVARLRQRRRDRRGGRACG